MRAWARARRVRARRMRARRMGAGVRRARWGWLGRRLANSAMRRRRGRKTDSRRAKRDTAG
jgi:hypothetical protein